MSRRRPTGAGTAGPRTLPNTVSPFHPERPPASTRRPLGASLPADERLVAYELRIRELGELIERLGAAVETLETARPADLDRAWGELRAVWVELEELHNRPFRRRPPGSLVRFPRP